MNKEELRSLIAHMCDELLEQIDVEEEPSKDQIAAYMQDATNTISSIESDKISSVEHAKLIFHNAHKEIAKLSLSHYQATNEKFEELTQMHKQTLQECHKSQINLPKITEKFNEIQAHMSAEVQRANTVINKLTTQVKELEYSSNLDSLTKIFNRRALSSYLETICNKKGLSYELHLLILDIDDFKQINDQYGHIAGDKILIFIANILRKTLREGDKVFRYGGEEFVIVLNRISPEVCHEITTRILKLIRKNQLIYKGNSVKVTMSIGATQYAQGDSPDTLIARADKALYTSKNNGKDQMNTEIK